VLSVRPVLAIRHSAIGRYSIPGTPRILASSKQRQKSGRASCVGDTEGAAKPVIHLFCPQHREPAACAQLGKPPSVRPSVDHRNGRDFLQTGDQVEKKGSRRRTAWCHRSCHAIEAEYPVQRDATEVQEPVRVACESVFERISKRGIPVTIEGENAAEDVRRRLGREGAAGVGTGRLVRWRRRTLAIFF
jgi:hypothetical protein